MSKDKNVVTLVPTPHDAEWHELALVLYRPGETGENVMCSSCFGPMQFVPADDGMVIYRCVNSHSAGIGRPHRKRML